MSKIFKFFGLDRLVYLGKVIKETGGIRASFWQIYRTDELKIGRLMGTDKYGNKYYEDKRHFISRSRWIDFAPKYGMDYDASQIPADWHGWMHYRTDFIPTEDPTRPQYTWMRDHTENLSGFRGEYYPYSTVRSRVEAWVPPKGTGKSGDGGKKENTERKCDA